MFVGLLCDMFQQDAFAICLLLLSSEIP